MNTQDKILEILKSVKCGFSLEINRHKNFYLTVGKQFEEWKDTQSSIYEEITSDMRQKMIELDTIIEIQFYMHTPVGFYSVFHYDLERALDECLEIINNSSDR